MTPIGREHRAGRAREDGSSVGNYFCGFRKEIVALFGICFTHVFEPPNTRSLTVTRTPIRLNNDDTAFNNSRSFLLFAALQW